jgi:hypothetical protein
MKFRSSEFESLIIQYVGLVLICTVVYFFAAWSGATNHSAGGWRSWGDPMPFREALAQVPTALAINAGLLGAVIIGAAIYTSVKH